MKNKKTFRSQRFQRIMGSDCIADRKDRVYFSTTSFAPDEIVWLLNRGEEQRLRNEREVAFIKNVRLLLNSGNFVKTDCKTEVGGSEI